MMKDIVPAAESHTAAAQNPRVVRTGGGRMLRVLFVGIYMLLSVTGIVLIKAGSGQTTVGLLDGSLQMKLHALTLGGMACYITSFLLFLKVLSMYELSYIVPITTGIVQVLILLAAVFIFKEKVSTVNLVGILIVITGIILMNLKQKGPTP